MKHHYTCYLACLLLLIQSCNGQAPKPTPTQPVSTARSNFIPTYNIVIEAVDSAYTNKCRTVKNHRDKLNLAYNADKIPLDSVANYFTESYLNTILPYWYGTTWAFEGYTSTPKQGEIACGYFVSTTLLHTGFNLNRYKIARQNPVNEARTYALNDSVYQFNSPAKVLTELKSNSFKEGFYFLGLGSNHVGLLLKRKGEVFFLHSNYIDGKTVIEFAEQSTVFNNYNAYYVVNLSNNAAFLKRWLSKQEIVTVTG